MDLPIVYLNKATFRDQSIIKIIFKNNKQIHTIIKESEWIAFNQECGTWTLPYSEKNIIQVLIDELKLIIDRDNLKAY